MTNEELVAKIEKVNKQFVKYQTLPEIGFIGKRPTEERYKIYELDRFINEDSFVLDYGCATGFFSLYLARKVKEVHGVEGREYLFDIATMTKEHIKAENCRFFHCDLMKYTPNMRYDLILSLSIHHWNMPKCHAYLDRCYSLTKVGGHLVFESHNLNKDPNFNSLIQYAGTLGYMQVLSKHHDDTTGKQNRMVSVLKKL